MGPSGPPGYPGEPVRIKKIQNQNQSTRAIIVCKGLFSDFRAYLGEMERMDFQGVLVKRSVCFDSTEQNADSGIRRIIEA